MGLKKIVRFFSRAYAGGRGLNAFGLLCSTLLLLAGGCGQPTETGKAYYNPTWGADGRIYAIKEVIKTYRQGGLSPSTSQQRESYLVVMNGDGSNEQEIKFVGVERYPKLNASPLGNYLAMYRDGVEILDIHNGYKHIHTIDVDNTFFDWSPDEGKLVLQTNQGVVLYDRSGNKIKTISALTYALHWHYNNAIAGANDTHILFVKIDNSNAEEIIASVLPGAGIYAVNQYFPDGNSYLEIVGPYSKISLFDFTVIETYPTLNTELSKESGVYNVQVNPVNAGEVMFSRDPVSTNSFAKQGIYLIRLDGTNRRVLRR
jgi:hypothetical protein